MGEGVVVTLCWLDKALPAVGKSQENVEDRGAGVVSWFVRDAEGFDRWADKLLARGGKDGR